MKQKQQENRNMSVNVRGNAASELQLTHPFIPIRCYDIVFFDENNLKHKSQDDIVAFTLKTLNFKNHLKQEETAQKRVTGSRNFSDSGFISLWIDIIWGKNYKNISPVRLKLRRLKGEACEDKHN